LAHSSQGGPMKTILSLIFLLTTTFATAGQLKGTDNESRRLIEVISRCKEVSCLIEHATREGDITLRINRDNNMPFEAMWQCVPREITLSQKGTYGRKIRHLIFELHNAITTREDFDFGELARSGKISCDDYVLKVEEIEHRNVVKAAKIIARGIQSGHFPEESRWNIVHNFPVHYQIQQLSGHSYAIVEEYREFCPKGYRERPYQGTIRRSSSQEENDQRGRDLYWKYCS